MDDTEHPPSENDTPTVAPAEPSPLRSVHTPSFAQLLDELHSSLLVTTYQAGKLVLVRSQEGVINTHFRAVDRPMGLAVGRARLSVGAALQVLEFRNVPAAVARLDPPDRHDGCFLPRSSHVTGNVQIHEMVYVGDELWFVNTRFSCLATLAPDYSFVPVWRPKFISQLTPDDRCHLNGIGLVDGRPRWATALGETDSVAGWRENKKDGGILLDIETNEVVARGLSMPHSPRWHAGRLWLLESGTGSLGFVDLDSGRYEPVIRLDGFTRGLTMVGNLAFVGLSQVRETATFCGIEITERLQESERTCGVCVVDIQRGHVVALLKFEEAVQEVFAVALLPGMRFPDIVCDDPGLLGSSFVLPDAAFRDVPPELRSSNGHS